MASLANIWKPTLDNVYWLMADEGKFWVSNKAWFVCSSKAISWWQMALLMKKLLHLLALVCLWKTVKSSLPTCPEKNSTCILTCCSICSLAKWLTWASQISWLHWVAGKRACFCCSAAWRPSWNLQATWKLLLDYVHLNKILRSLDNKIIIITNIYNHQVSK